MRSFWSNSPLGLLFIFLLLAISTCASPTLSQTPTQSIFSFSPVSLVSRLESTLLNRLSFLLLPSIKSNPASKTHSFTLKQAFHKGTHSYPKLTAKLDYHPEQHPYNFNLPSSSTTLRSRKQVVTRPRDPKAFLEARGNSYEKAQCAAQDALDWDVVEIDAPDVDHRPTLLALAMMASQAYDNDTSQWEPGFGGFNLSESFGWVEDGIRGHVFVTEDNSTIVVALKGTSAALLPGGGETAKRDKMNDNLLFSCCCARVSWTWPTVCDCYESDGQCGQTCVERALIEKSVYYPATTDLYNNISYSYPDSNIWITGHSLGGALSALLGMTFGLPTVTFEAPGDRIAAQRLHLPLPPRKNPDESPIASLPITHVYNTADTIAMGECNGVTSPCATAGYAMESRCHSGKSIVYDTVGKLGWSKGIASHRIGVLVDDLLKTDWDKKVGGKEKKNGWWGEKKPKKGEGEGQEGDGEAKVEWKWPWQSGGDPENDDGPLGPVPNRRSEDACRDCTDWKFSDS